MISMAGTFPSILPQKGPMTSQETDGKRRKQLGYQHAGIVSRFTYNFVEPLIRLGVAQRIEERTSDDFLPSEDTAEKLSTDFEAAYSAVQALHPSASPAGLLWRTYLRLYKWHLLLQLAWTLAEVATRVGPPLVLRQLLNWFVGHERYGGQEYPVGRGWMWAGILGSLGYFYTVIHHQLFWVGMRAGFQMRLQAIAAVQAKVLRLNSMAVADVSPGKIVNLVSNDVRRFDDAATFWNFLICGPVELAIVLVLVGLKLGFAAAVSGVATLLLLIPIQGMLVRYIGRLRANTAAQTDERVRLTGEAIDGVLAAKMMGWEEPIEEQIHTIRQREAAYIHRMARIRALNMALSYAISPLVSLITFAVARATSQQLSVANLFYALALLSLPKLSMADFFVRGVEFVSEVRISIQRLGEFLQLPEPPAPVHAAQQQQQQGAGAAQPPAADKGGASNNSKGGGQQASLADDIVVSVGGVDFDWGDRSWVAGAAAGEAFALRQKSAKGGEQQQGAKPAAAPANAAAADAANAASTASTASAAQGTVQIEVATQGAAAGGRPAAAAATAGISAAAARAAAPDSATTHPTLKDLSFQVHRGHLVAIVGEVGSGKSSVLAALLGELQPIRRAPGSGGGVAVVEGSGAGGDVVVRGRVAFCSQVPWIVSGSFKSNVLFGKPYEEGRYEAVLEACALCDDVAALPAGDETELGERGINLSGGQKARLALARAAYSRADVQLLDDPLSAVDPRVGRVLFQECIGPSGLMAGSTRLLVTHQRQYLPSCDLVLVIQGGRVVERGTYAELAAKGLPQVIASHETELDDSTYDSHTQGSQQPQGQGGEEEDGDEGGEGQADDDSSSEDKGSPRSRVAPSEGINSHPSLNGSVNKGPGGGKAATEGRAPRQGGHGLLAGVSHRLSRVFRRSWKGPLPHQPSANYLRRILSTKLMAGRRSQPVEGDGSQEGSLGGQLGKSGRLIMSEDRVTGGVSTSVYTRYFKYMGTLTVIFITVCLLGGQATYLTGDYWLASWASKSPEEQEQAYWVWGYAIFAGSIVLVSVVRSLLFFSAALKASTAIHDAMVDRVLHAPLTFFHTNPTGRVLNRFSRDLGAVDELLPQCLFDSVQALMMVLGAFVLLMVCVPYIIPIFLPLGFGFFWVRRRYLATSREIKRFEAVSRSPVYSSFSAVLKGLPTIRAYGAGPRFRAAFLADLTHNGSWWFCFLTTARWIGFRLDMLVAILMTVAPLLMMAVHSKLEARLAGLALTQSLQLGGLLQWMVRQTAEVENHMTSVERMLTYTELEQEPPAVAQGGGKPPAGWPSGGCVEYDKVTAIYRPGLPPVLRGLSFTIAGGVSCGVVGRTGSGKSSLMLTLFRLIPVTSGRIRLDGVDTSSLGLDALRRQVAIIPQDPVLFSGTLRSNLDPWNKFDDARLWEVLKTVQLGAAVAGYGGLDSRMSEAGDNLSVGQRQLFCLARALLQEAAILALDEATANVDRTTDALIQQSVRECTRMGGRQRTLLVIAHRIDTIMDCDQLLVLARGRLVESGAPTQLVRGGGVFAHMVAAAQDAARQQHGHM